MDGDWWTGVLDGVQGIFPSNYVQPRYEVAPPLSKIVPAHSTPPQNTEAQGSVSLLNKPIVARVTVPFEAQKENQLSLSYGDLVKVNWHLCIIHSLAASYIFTLATHNSCVL